MPEAPRSHPYENLTERDRCPTTLPEKGKENKIIKNCACPECLQWKTQQSPAKIDAEAQRKTVLSTKERIAILSLICGSIGIGNILSGKSHQPITSTFASPTESTPFSSPEINKVVQYEREFLVEGLQVEMDVSWERYQTESGEPVSECIKQILTKGIPFLRELGIPLPEKVTLSYNPRLLDSNIIGVSQDVLQILQESRKDGYSVFNDNQDGNFWWISREQNYRIVLGGITPGTIIHELLHCSDDFVIKGSVLWSEGIAEAVEQLFLDAHPELQPIPDLANKNVLDRVINNDHRTLQILSDPEIVSQFTAHGWEQQMPYALPSRYKTPSFIQKISGVLWKDFLKQHPEFLKKLFLQMKGWQEQQKRKSPYMPENAKVMFNCNVLFQAGKRCDPDFESWYQSHSFFQLAQEGDKQAIVIIQKTEKSIDSFAFVMEQVQEMLPRTLGEHRRIVPKALELQLFADPYILSPPSQIQNYSISDHANQITHAETTDPQTPVIIFRR